jgi:hypothetical protein
MLLLPFITQFMVYGVYKKSRGKLIEFEFELVPEDEEIVDYF